MRTEQNLEEHSCVFFVVIWCKVPPALFSVSTQSGPLCCSLKSCYARCECLSISTATLTGRIHRGGLTWRLFTRRQHWKLFELPPATDGFPIALSSVLLALQVLTLPHPPLLSSYPSITLSPLSYNYEKKGGLNEIKDDTGKKKRRGIILLWIR